MSMYVSTRLRLSTFSLHFFQDFNDQAAKGLRLLLSLAEPK